MSVPDGGYSRNVLWAYLMEVIPEDDEGVFKIMQYSEMECNCVRKITKGYLESTVRYDSTNVKVK